MVFLHVFGANWTAANHIRALTRMLKEAMVQTKELEELHLLQDDVMVRLFTSSSPESGHVLIEVLGLPSKIHRLDAKGVLVQNLAGAINDWVKEFKISWESTTVMVLAFDGTMAQVTKQPQGLD